jgi:hypothetical protein
LAASAPTAVVSLSQGPGVQRASLQAIRLQPSVSTSLLVASRLASLRLLTDGQPLSRANRDARSEPCGRHAAPQWRLYPSLKGQIRLGRAAFPASNGAKSPVLYCMNHLKMKDGRLDAIPPGAYEFVTARTARTRAFSQGGAPLWLNSALRKLPTNSL